MNHTSGMIHRLGKILKTRGAKKALAVKIGKPASIISDVCSGKDRINDDLIELISNALNIPPWHLFADPEEVRAQIYPASDRLIVQAYHDLEPELREIVDKLLFLSRELKNPNFTESPQTKEKPQ